MGGEKRRVCVYMYGISHLADDGYVLPSYICTYMRTYLSPEVSDILALIHSA